MDMELIKIVFSSLSGVAAIVTLIYQLIKYVGKSIKEKRWSELISLVMTYMERAETMFKTGAEKKEWVLAMVRASADTIKYEVDMNVISETIDKLCNMSKVVNSPAKKAGE